VRAAAYGGAGGARDLQVAHGGDAVAIDAVGGETSGKLTLLQSALGGTVRGSGVLDGGGRGGDAISGLERDFSAGELEVQVIAQGGDGFGGASAPLGFRGGWAESHADLSNDGGPIDVVVSAFGGRGSSGGEGGSAGGSASATSRAVGSQGRVAASARAYAGTGASDAGGAAASALARSIATGANPAEASADARGATGEARSIAEASAGIFDLLRATAVAPVADSTVGTRALVNSGALGIAIVPNRDALAWVQSGGIEPGLLASAGFSFSRSPMLAASPGAGGPSLALETPPSRVEGAIEVVLDPSQAALSAQLVIAFQGLALGAASPGAVRVTLAGDETVLLDALLGDVSALEAFFSSTLLVGDLLLAAGLEEISTLSLTLGLEGGGGGGGLATGFALMIVPEPGTALLVLVGLAAMARRQRGRG